jgi:hypothetical protein
MKNKNSLSNDKLDKASGGVYNKDTHSVEQLHYDDPEMEKVAQETYAESLMNGQNINMASQNKGIKQAVEKKALDKSSALKEITTYQPNHNM